MIIVIILLLNNGIKFLILYKLGKKNNDDDWIF